MVLRNVYTCEVLPKLKQKNSLLFKALVPDSFCMMSNLSLGGRVIDTQLWMSGHGLGLHLPVRVQTMLCGKAEKWGERIREVFKVT